MKRARVDGWGLGALIGGLALALGCKGPAVGGQTGDPSAGMSGRDHVSGMLDPDGQSGGSCAPLTMTDVPRAAALRWPALGGGAALVLETTAGDPRRLVVTDFAFGLRVVDASDPETLRPGTTLELDDPPVQQHRLDDGRVLVLTEGEVLLVSLAGDAPSVLARAELAGRPRSSHLLARDDEPWLHVVVDTYLVGEDVSTLCPPRLGTSIARYAVDGDELTASAEIDLGDAVHLVRFEADGALVVTGAARDGEFMLRPSSVQWLALTRDEPSLGPRSDLPGAIARASDVRLTGNVLEALVLHLGEARAELVRFDASDSEALAPLPGCELPLEGSRETRNNDPDGWMSHRSLFTPAGVVVRDGRADSNDAAPETGRIARVGDSGCELQELELPASAELLLGPAGTLLALGGERSGPFGGENGPLEIALFDLTASAQTPVATVSLPIEDSDERVTHFWSADAALLSDAVMLGDDASPETALLLVPQTATDRQAYAETIAMVSVGPSSLTARGELDSSFASLQLGERLLVAGHDRLQALELDGAALPAPLAASALWPLVGEAWLLSDAIAQERSRAGDPWSEAAAVRLELVTRGEREVLGELAAAGESRLFRVGDRIVALELTDTWGGGAPPTLRVFDLDDPADPHEVGRLEDDALRADWEPLNSDPASIDWSWAATGDALILRSMRNVDDDLHGHTVFDFQVIDLSDPSAPELHDFAMPDEHRSADALFAGETVYYTYAVQTAKSREERREVRYFMQTIDVSDPGAPVLSEPINVPGEVIAVDGETLYLRDASWQDDELAHFVRRVELADGEARITASVETGMRVLSARLTDAGDLAVTLFERPCLYCQDGDSTLRLLTADELDVRTELELAGRCRIAGQVRDTLVIESPYRNVQLVDIAQGGFAEITRVISSAKLADLRGDELLYIRGHVWGGYGNAGALHRLDLSQD